MSDGRVDQDLDGRQGSRIGEFLATFPSFGWLCLFFLVPTLIVFAIAFRPADIYGGIGDGWTLETLFRLFTPNYPAIIWRTIWLSVVATVVCLTLAVIVGYCLARIDRGWRPWIMLMVVVPFWTNFLIRVFAWKTVLHTNGPFRRALVSIGLVDSDQPLLFTSGAVLLVLIYTYLPFAILPVYAAAEKFDFGLLEAARDLGSTSTRAFVTVFLPGIRRGVATAAIMVLVPSLGSYVIPDLVGGTESEMIGNKIAQYVLTERNLPRASALSAVLTVTVVVVLLALLWLGNRRRREKGGAR